MIKHLIGRGIGFSPGSVGFIPTLGFGSAEPTTITRTGMAAILRQHSLKRPNRPTHRRKKERQ